MTKEIVFFAQFVSSEAGHYRGRQKKNLTIVEAKLSSIDESDILNQFTAYEILNHLDKDEFLELIGENYVREYFGIESTDGTEG